MPAPSPILIHPITDVIDPVPIPVVGPDVLATPVLALLSAPNTTPVTFTLNDTDYIPGLYGELQFDTDPAFGSVDQKPINFIDGASWANLSMTFDYVDPPSGRNYVRIRFLRDDENGGAVTDQLGNTFNAIASLWSNTVIVDIP